MKRKSILCILVIGLIFVIIGLFLTRKYKSDEGRNGNPLDPTPTMNPDDEINNYKYSGIYSNGKIELYLYQIDDDKLYFAIDSGIYGRAIVTEDYAEGTRASYGKGFDYKFTLTNGKLNVDTDDTSIDNGLYEKKESITPKKYYSKISDNYNLLYSKYNGKYKKGKVEVNMFQIEEKSVYVIILDNERGGSMKRVFYIDDENTISSSTNNEVNTIKIEKDNIIFETSIINKNNFSYNSFDGEYTFEKNVTIDDIIGNEVLYYF